MIDDFRYKSLIEGKDYDDLTSFDFETTESKFFYYINVFITYFCLLRTRYYLEEIKISNIKAIIWGVDLQINP